MDWLKYGRLAWRQQRARLQATGRATEDLCDLLSGALGVGFLLTIVAVLLGLGLTKLLAALGAPVRYTAVVSISALSAPPMGYCLWAGLGAARVRLALIHWWVDKSDRRRGATMGRRSVNFILQSKRYSVAIAVVWFGAILWFLLSSSAT